MTKQWRNTRVLVTGHTGFKGGWMTRVLHNLGAEVTGYSLAPETRPSFFEIAGVSKFCKSHIADIRDLDSLKKVLKEARPQVIFHLAAQPLVRRSYAQPVETYSTNVMGTVHVLEAARVYAETADEKLEAIVTITTDKVYENREQRHGYLETDTLGGHDPYSNSKACAELVALAYRRSFLNSLKVPMATARAGNVIGGGDWSEDRLIPDFIRAAQAGRPLILRNPKAVRPWQHVIEPVVGYLTLAAALRNGSHTHDAYNFGPDESDARSVEEIINYSCQRFGTGARWELSGDAHPHETHLLTLNATRAAHDLKVVPKMNWSQAVDWTLDWYKQVHVDPGQALKITDAQIDSYLKLSGAHL